MAFPVGVHLKGGRAGGLSHAANAREFYAPIVPVVVELRSRGLSLRAIARELDARGIVMRQEEVPGRSVHTHRWSACQVRRVLAMATPKPADEVHGYRPSPTTATVSPLT